MCMKGEREKEVRERNLYKYKQTSISICIENHISSAQAAQNLGESDPSTNIISDSMTPPPVPHLLFSNRQIISKILPIYLNSHCSCDCMQSQENQSGRAKNLSVAIATYTSVQKQSHTQTEAELSQYSVAMLCCLIQGTEAREFYPDLTLPNHLALQPYPAIDIHQKPTKIQVYPSPCQKVPYLACIQLFHLIFYKITLAN